MKNNTDGTWDVVSIRKWEDFVSHINTNNIISKKWIFRGQEDRSWPISSSFKRIMKKINKVRIVATETNRKSFHEMLYYERENLMINLFKSKSHLYIDINPDRWVTEDQIEDNGLKFCKFLEKSVRLKTIKKLEWLALMQHYAAPTRLSDWTFSPYIAAFFALENLSDKSCVFALNYSEIEKINECYDSEGATIDLLGDDNKKEPILFGYESIIKNERISHQQGLFIVPSSLTSDISDIFSIYKDKIGKSLGYKYIFHNSMIYESIFQLKKMNVTSEILYPDINGFSSSIKFNILDRLADIRHL